MFQYVAGHVSGLCYGGVGVCSVLLSVFVVHEYVIFMWPTLTSVHICECILLQESQI